MELNWRKEYSRYKGFFLNIADLYKKRQDVKMFLEVILSLGAIIIFSLFALKPTATTIAKLIRDIDDKKKTLALLDQKIADINKARSVLSQNQQKIQLLNQAIPDGASLDTFAAQIESVSTTGPATILGASADEVLLVGTSKKTANKNDLKLPAGIEGINVNISLAGNYDQLLTVLRNLENMRRPIIITSAKIYKPKTTEEDASNLNLAIGGQIPYFIDTSSK